MVPFLGSPLLKKIYIFFSKLIFLPSNTHTHTQWTIYIYIYIFVEFISLLAEKKKKKILFFMVNVHLTCKASKQTHSKSMSLFFFENPKVWGSTLFAGRRIRKACLSYPSRYISMMMMQGVVSCGINQSCFPNPPLTQAVSALLRYLYGFLIMFSSISLPK